MTATAETAATAAAAPLATWDAWINAAVQPWAEVVSGVVFFSVRVGPAEVPLVVGWLIAMALVFTVLFRGIQWWGFRHAVRVVRGHFSRTDMAGEVTPFQALTAAISGTVGLGNIAGVAVAVSVGGAGATFWMIVAGLLGMASKFVEVTLGVKYRQVHADGSVSGGPMRYLAHGLAERGWPQLGRALAAFFAVCCVGGALGGGNMFQANQSYQQVLQVTGGAHSVLVGYGWAFGVGLAALVGLVILGGIQSIARVTQRVVPVMAGLYLVAGLAVVVVHADRLPWALWQIVSGAFSVDGVAGGVLGALVQGFKRAAFSNEAGVGSAAIAHAAVQTDQPASQGFAALLEPFIDTVLICTLTALVIIVTGHADAGGATAQAAGATGVALTSMAFGSVAGWFPYLLVVTVLLFAYSTLLTWSYYGLKAWTYLLGHSAATERGFKALFLVCVVVGASAELGPLVDFADAMVFAMAVANGIGLYLLTPVVRRELEHYLTAGQAGMILRLR